MYRELETILKAAGDRNRLRILHMLAEGPLCVCQIVSVLDLTQPTISKHLSVLKNARLIEDEKRGKWVFYEIARDIQRDPDRRRLLRLIEKALAADPEARRDLKQAGREKAKDLAARCSDESSPRSKARLAAAGGRP
jgi:DNA-binding transcriptional ArsR family regulator